MLFLNMESLNEVWDKVRALLEENISDVSFSVWLDPVSALEINSSEFVLLAPNNFTRNIIIDQFTPQIEDAFREVTGLPLPVRVIIPAEAQARNSPDDLYKYTFENFIVGASNQFAYAAATSVARDPGSSYNPLFIYGQPGLGKTHLLFAISTAISNNNPKAVITYIKGDQFTNELIQALGEGRMSDFHSKYRYSDVLLVDDVQFIAGKERTQEEFFHTFNALFQDRKQIVLTSDRPPKEISTLDERLRSRFEHGLLADIQPADFETRMAILKRKASMIGLDLDDSVCSYIASKLKSNIRQLEGVIKKMSVICMVEKDKPNIITAQTAIKDILSDVTPPSVQIDRVITEVSRNFELSPDDIRSQKRSGKIPLARQVSMYIIREVTDLTYKEIGESFGSKDHTTVIYSVKQVEDRMKKQPDFRANIEDIIKNVRNNEG